MGRIASLITALLLVMGTTVIGAARTATASVWWAWDDPVVVINGQVVHVLAGVPADARGQVTSAEVVITVPSGVDAKLTAVNAPHFPLTARLERVGAVGTDGSVTVAASLIVRGRGQFATALRIVQPSGNETIAYGVTDQPVQASIHLTAPGQGARATAMRASR